MNNNKFEAAKTSFEAAIKFAQLSLTSVLTLNGAAALSLMTFLGHVYQTNQAWKPLALSLVFFACGAASSVAAVFWAYLTQILFCELKDEVLRVRLGNIARVIAFSFACVGLTLFIAGVGRAAIAILSPNEISVSMSSI